MQFYLVPAHDGQPQKLETTQALARATAKARGLRPSEFTDYEVRTDKAGLAAHLNELLARVRPEMSVDEIKQSNTPEAHAAYEQFKAANRSELHPPYNSPWSARECLADMDVGRTVKMIRQLDGARLGKLTAACVERIEALRQENEHATDA